MTILNSVILISLLLLTAPSGWAQNIILEDYSDYNQQVYQSHWEVLIFSEALQRTSVDNFSLTHKQNFERKELFLGLAPLFARHTKFTFWLNGTTAIGPFFYQNSDREAVKPSNESVRDYVVGDYEQKDLMYGIRLLQTLEFPLDFGSLIVSPFFEAYLNYGYSTLKTEYVWNTQISSELEEYQMTQKERFTTQGVSAGLKFAGPNGLLTYLKLSKTTWTFSDKKRDTYVRAQGTTPLNTSEEFSDEQLMDQYALGLGVGIVF